MMIQKFTNYALLCCIILPVLWFASCAEEGIIEETPRVTIPESQELVTGTLYGQIMDEQGAPIAGAEITYNSGLNPLFLTTDAEGYFLIEDVKNKGRAAFISVTHPGKFEAFRRFSIVPNRNNYTEIKMMNRDIIGSVDAQTGGILDQEDGASIDLPANGIVNNNGQTYTGTVEVAMAWIDPSADDLAQRMVGDLSGIDLDGNQQSLSSMGMLQVELIGSNGALLNLGEGESAALTFPIPPSLQDDAQPTIPLWSYDELAGTWIQEGEAELQGDTYVGVVSHFSSWNVDFKTDPIEIKGQINWEVLKSNGQDTVVGGSYLQVYVCSEKIGRKGGWLCEDGSFRFYNFPKDERFQLKVFDKCGNTIYEESYGPYGNDEDLGVISVDNNAGSVVRIVGNAVDCNNQPITKGVVNVSQGENSDNYPINEDGTFEIGYAYCQGFDIGIEIIDFVNLQSSGELIIASGETNAEYSDVQACDELENFISIDVEGQETKIFTTDNYLFSSDFFTDSTSTISDSISVQIIHESDNGFQRGLFVLSVLIPQDYETNTGFDMTNLRVKTFFYSTDSINCSSEFADQMILSFGELNLTPGGKSRGTYSGNGKCVDWNQNTETSISVTGDFKVTTR